MALHLIIPVLVAIFPSATPEETPTAEGVIERYLEASGGREKLEKITTRVTKGTFDVSMMPMSASMVSYVAPPNLYTKVSMTLVGSMERGVIGGVAFEVNPMTGARIVTDTSRGDLDRNSHINWLLEWKRFFEKAAYAGEVDFEGAKCHKLDFTKYDGLVLSFFFDKATGLLAGQEYINPEGKGMRSMLRDYRPVDGIQIPHAMEGRGGPVTFKATLTSVEHNVAIAPETFTLPTAIVALLPTPDATAAASEAELAKR